MCIRDRFEDIINTDVTLIYGEQHHIYTVLSIIIHCTDGTGDGELKLKGWDAKGGGSGSYQILTKIAALQTNSTFVWNDKFSFNGYEPINFTGPLDDATKQDAIADQGSGVAQHLYCFSDNAADSSMVTITYIDQNNA